jgi:hypothetical protein
MSILDAAAIAFFFLAAFVFLIGPFTTQEYPDPKELQ